MASVATYKRTHDEENGGIQDKVEIEIEADSKPDQQELLHDMNLLHDILEKHGVFKKDSGE